MPLARREIERPQLAVELYGEDLTFTSGKRGRDARELGARCFASGGSLG